ncbi:MAG: hypothetical protein AAGA86_01855 [Bacteroidota bacterium]
MTEELRLYGSGECVKTAEIRGYLIALSIPFQEWDVKKDKKAEEMVRALLEGNLIYPTLTYDGYYLENPNTAQLKNFLKAHKLV